METGSRPVFAWEMRESVISLPAHASSRTSDRMGDGGIPSTFLRVVARPRPALVAPRVDFTIVWSMHIPSAQRETAYLVSIVGGAGDCMQMPTNEDVLVVSRRHGLLWSQCDLVLSFRDTPEGRAPGVHMRGPRIRPDRLDGSGDGLRARKSGSKGHKLTWCPSRKSSEESDTGVEMTNRSCSCIVESTRPAESTPCP